MVKVGVTLKMQYLMPSCPETKPLSVSLISGCFSLPIALSHSLRQAMQSIFTNLTLKEALIHMVLS